MESEYAYGAFGSAGVVGLISVVGGYYGVVTRSRTRPNYPFLTTGLTLSVVPAALGAILIIYDRAYKNADEAVRKYTANIYELDKAKYIKLQQDAAIGLMVTTLSFPLGVGSMYFLYNENVRMFSILAGASAVCIVAGMTTYGVQASAAEEVIKKLRSYL
jgi:hypothetical protein